LRVTTKPKEAKNAIIAAIIFWFCIY
jgi:hypothetical protein